MEVRFIQPYSFNKNIGHEYNKVVSELPDGCWVVITDQDTLKPPLFANRCFDVIKTLKVNDLCTSMTNRVRRNNPAVIHELYDESDINLHLLKAEDLWENNRTSLIRTKVAAGYCMIFNKSLWQKVGGFRENLLTFDSHFSYDVSTNGGRVLLAKGLYLFHLYRWGIQNPEQNISHLIE